MRATGREVTDDEVQAMIDEVDHDGNGTVDFPEFLTLHRGCNLSDPVIAACEVEIRAAFRAHDEGTGRVPAAALRPILRTLGEELTDDELLEIRREVGVDGDGFVDYERLIRLMA